MKVEDSSTIRRILRWLLYFSLLLILQCKKPDKKVDDFSWGLANRDPAIMEGIGYIEKEDIRRAKEFFGELGQKNPNHCGYLVGFPLAQIQDYLAKISSIINFVVGAYSSGSPSAPKHISVEQVENCDPTLDNMLREFIFEMHNNTGKGISLFEKAIANKCEMELNFPLRLSVGPNFSLYITMNGRFGEAELQIMNFIGYWILTLSAAILAHDYSIDTLSILSNIKNIDTSNIVGLLRSLAFIFPGCGRTLAFHSKDMNYIFKIPEFVARSISAGRAFLKALEQRSGSDVNYIFSFKDNSGEGKIGYFPEDTTPGLSLDEVTVNIGGSTSVGNVKANIKALKIKIPYIITTEFIEEGAKVVEKLDSIIQNKKVGCPENCISIAELNFFLRPLNTSKFDDFLRLDIMRYFSNPKPLRELLPYWFQDEERKWKFVIEAEVPPSRKDLTNYLFNYDAPHFEYPKEITFYGKYLTGFSIPPDCVSLENVKEDWVLAPYILFQDPTFSGVFWARMKNVIIELCNTYDYEYEVEEWKPTNVYMLNKAIAIITQKAGSIISPLTDLIIQSVEVIE